MPPSPKSAPQFVKVAECLYRNSSSGTYFALVKRKGKQIRRSLRTNDRKLAERRLREFRETVGLLSASSADRKTPFSVLAQVWLDSHNSPLKSSSADRNRRCVKELNKHFGALPVSEITVRHCEDWVTRRGRGIAASTFNKDAEVLKAVLDRARREGLILENPARGVKRRRVVDKELTIPNRTEFRLLLEALNQLDYRARESAKLTQLLAYSGMRLGEATRITWREIDFTNDRFTVSGGDVGTKNHEIRVVPLFPTLRRFLEPLRDERCPTPTERVIPISTTKTALASACGIARLPHFTHHSLRHYFVSNAIEAGVDFKTIAAWLGHKDGGVLVARRYGHLRKDHSDLMATRM